MNTDIEKAFGLQGAFRNAAKHSFLEYYSQNLESFREGEAIFRTLIQSIVRDSEIPFQAILSRIKSSDSCLEKFDRKYQQLEKNDLIQDLITDLIGIRVICLYEDDVTKIADILESNFTSIEPRTDKYQERKASPNEFGYQAIHTQLNTR